MKVCLTCGRSFRAVDWNCPNCGQSPELHQGYLAFAPNLAENTAGFKKTFFEQLAGLEKGNFWFESRNRLLTWAIGRYFPGADNFLEIGCGTGFALSGIRREFPGLVLYGSEVLTSGLAFAEARVPSATLFQMDARRIPFENEFDVIGAFDVLEHIVEDEVVLSQLHRATNPGGGIMLTVPQHRFLWSVVDEYSHHQRRYTRDELVEKAKGAGFEIIRATSFVSIPLPLMLLSRLAWRRLQDDFDPLAEFKIVNILNVLLRKTMDFERTIIRNGFSFSAGGSLLVIARRL